MLCILKSEASISVDSDLSEYLVASDDDDFDIKIKGLSKEFLEWMIQQMQEKSVKDRKKVKKEREKRGEKKEEEDKKGGQEKLKRKALV
jgi:hypothetical protein